MVAGVVAANDRVPSDWLAMRATEIGEAWAHEYVRDLLAQARPPVGAWPGTMSEARRRVVTHLAGAIDRLRVDELARLANLAARRGWLEMCESRSRG